MAPRAERLLVLVKVALARVFALCLVLLALSLSQGREARDARTFLTRLALEVLAGHLVLVAVAERARLTAYLRDFFWASASPVNLAVFRICFFTILYREIDWEATLGVARLARSMLDPPTGLGWLLPWWPHGEAFARGALATLCLATVSAGLGFFTRTSAAVATLGAFYVLGLPNFLGKVHHGHHHLIWFGMLLAASRCGDALSVDAWIRTRRGLPAPGACVAYELPRRIVWILMGVLYFYPGFFKLWTSGIDWVASDNFIHMMHYKWYEMGGAVPWYRPDRYPTLLRLGGMAAIAFELLFLPAVFFRALRVPLAIVGMSFHGLTELLLLIPFRALQACYVVFVDWEALYRRVSGWTGHAGKEAPCAGVAYSVRPVALVGAFLVLVNGYQGAVHRYFAWPFSLFPTFEQLNESVVTPGIRMEAFDAHGPRPELQRALDHVKAQLDPARWRMRLVGIIVAQGRQQRMNATLPIWEECTRQEPRLREATVLRVYQTIDSLNPEDYPKNPLRVEPLFEIDLR